MASRQKRRGKKEDIVANWSKGKAFMKESMGERGAGNQRVEKKREFYPELRILCVEGGWQGNEGARARRRRRGE